MVGLIHVQPERINTTMQCGSNQTTPPVTVRVMVSIRVKLGVPSLGISWHLLQDPTGPSSHTLTLTLALTLTLIPWHLLQDPTGPSMAAAASSRRHLGWGLGRDAPGFTVGTSIQKACFYSWSGR